MSAADAYSFLFVHQKATIRFDIEVTNALRLKDAFGKQLATQKGSPEMLRLKLWRDIAGMVERNAPVNEMIATGIAYLSLTSAAATEHPDARGFLASVQRTPKAASSIAVIPAAESLEIETGGGRGYQVLAVAGRAEVEAAMAEARAQ